MGSMELSFPQRGYLRGISDMGWVEKIDSRAFWEPVLAR